jgi:GAF domain-containing protein
MICLKFERKRHDRFAFEPPDQEGPMPFAAALRESLQHRDSQVSIEFRRGDTLEDVLNRHLMTVEGLGGEDVFTCILLLSSDGKRLSYGAAPTVPPSYCRASESFEVGPTAGSCGAAVYYGRPVYSPDIAKDDVWSAVRDLALQHGFRSCWSTPIRNRSDTIIGSFAILHRARIMPTAEEINAIEMIIGHVADAIMYFRQQDGASQFGGESAPRPALKLVSNNDGAKAPRDRLLALAAKLELKAADLDLYSSRAESAATAGTLRNAAALCRELVRNLRARQTSEGSREPRR